MLERIEQVLDEQVRPYLQGHGGAGEVRELTEDGLLRVRLLGHCAGCPSATITTEQIIQEAVCAAIPEVRQVVLVEEIDEDLLAQARAILRRRASPDGGK